MPKLMFHVQKSVLVFVAFLLFVSHMVQANSSIEEDDAAARPEEFDSPKAEIKSNDGEELKDSDLYKWIDSLFLITFNPPEHSVMSLSYLTSLQFYILKFPRQFACSQ
jgi:hypothetical protein